MSLAISPYSASAQPNSFNTAGAPPADQQTSHPKPKRTGYDARLVLMVQRGVSGPRKENLEFKRILQQAQEALKKAPLTSATYTNVSQQLDQKIAELEQEVEKIESDVRKGGNLSIPMMPTARALQSIVALVLGMRNNSPIWKNQILKEQIASITTPFKEQIPQLGVLKTPLQRTQVQTEFSKKINYDGQKFITARPDDLVNKLIGKMNEYNTTCQSLIARLKAAVDLVAKNVNERYRVPISQPEQISSTVTHSPASGDARVEEAQKKAIDQLTSRIDTKTPEDIEAKFEKFQNEANELLARDAGNDSSQQMKKIQDARALFMKINQLGGEAISHLQSQQAKFKQELSAANESFRKELAEFGLEDSQTEAAIAALKTAAGKINTELDKNAQAFIDKCMALMRRVSTVNSATPSQAS